MPTPIEHYQRAEALIAEADKATDPLSAQRLVMRAGVHAQLAAVAWGGDDRDLEEVALGLDGAQVAGLVAVVTELRDLTTRTVGTIPDDLYDPAEAWVAGVQSIGKAVTALVEPIAREVLDR